MFYLLDVFVLQVIKARSQRKFFLLGLAGPPANIENSRYELPSIAKIGRTIMSWQELPRERATFTRK